MVNHPRNAQAAIDRRWHDVQIDVAREKLAMTAPSPAAPVPSWLHCHVARLSFLRQSLSGWWTARPGVEASRSRGVELELHG